MIFFKGIGKGLKSVKARYYLLEFILIFIAVAAGAFVDNFRDYLNDKEKEQYLLQLLLEDLASDGLNYESEINELEQKLKDMDSLLYLLSTIDINDKNQVKSLYHFQFAASPIISSVGAQRTKIQIEDSGISIVSSRVVTNELINYWNLLDEISLMIEVFNNDYRMEAKKEAHHIFDARFNFQPSQYETHDPSNLSLMKNYEEHIPVYYNWISMMRDLIEFRLIPNFMLGLEDSKALKETINEEY